jgi:hypothetical protein
MRRNSRTPKKARRKTIVGEMVPTTATPKRIYATINKRVLLETVSSGKAAGKAF